MLYTIMYVTGNDLSCVYMSRAMKKGVSDVTTKFSTGWTFNILQQCTNWQLLVKTNTFHHWHKWIFQEWHSLTRINFDVPKWPQEMKWTCILLYYLIKLPFKLIDHFFLDKNNAKNKRTMMALYRSHDYQSAESIGFSVQEKKFNIDFQDGG